MPQMFQIEGREVLREQGQEYRRLAGRIKPHIFDSLVKRNTEGRAAIKRVMPVDFGDAQGRWGTPGYSMRNPQYRGRSGRGIWRVNKQRLTVTQGADLQPHEYINDLNAGHSRQAPAGFVDAEMEKIADRVARDLEIQDWWR